MSVNHSFVFDFERNFDYQGHAKWFREHNYLPVSAIIAYIGLIFILKNYMKTREAFDLKKPLAAWNFCLAIFSICGSLRTVPLVYTAIVHSGFNHSLCETKDVDNVGMFWGWLFALSKILEFGDTFFIVLRKRKLLFLQWYHHASVLEFCWVGFGLLFPPGRWVVSLNFTVHAIMYSYYGLRAVGLKLPRKVSMAITLLQMFQMLGAVFIMIYLIFLRLRGITCEIPSSITNLLMVVIITYFVLFSNYFYKSYVKSDSEKMKKM